ncbi:hypothetical protein H4K36_02020 [Streptomyces sp. DHE7-1]|nr:hypothetical protein [Streptomyces sp. DHE7-1]
MYRRPHRLRRHRLSLTLAGVIVLAAAGAGTYAMAAQPTSASFGAADPPVQVFDACGYGSGTQWAPRRLAEGAHDLAGTPADRDVSGVTVAAGYRALLFDRAAATRPALTLTADRDLCGTPLNDRIRRIVVQRADAPTPPPPTPVTTPRQRASPRCGC